MHHSSAKSSERDQSRASEMSETVTDLGLWKSPGDACTAKVVECREEYAWLRQLLRYMIAKQTDSQRPC